MKSFLLSLSVMTFASVAFVACGGDDAISACEDSCDCEYEGDEASECKDQCNAYYDLLKEAGCDDEADDLVSCGGGFSCEDEDDDGDDDNDCDDEQRAFLQCQQEYCEENPEDCTESERTVSRGSVFSRAANRLFY